MNATEIMSTYRMIVHDHLQSIAATESDAITAAAELIADRVVADELVYAYGPGGHSNLAAQEVFFRAGGLVNISAILDGGTLLSNGALRSMAMERLPGYGKLVIDDNDLGDGDLLILVKPQFEAGRDQVEKGGVIHDSAVHARTVARVAAWANDHDLRVRGVVRSPLIGPAGNREFFLWLRVPQNRTR